MQQPVDVCGVGTTSPVLCVLARMVLLQEYANADRRSTAYWLLKAVKEHAHHSMQMQCNQLKKVSSSGTKGGGTAGHS